MDAIVCHRVGLVAKNEAGPKDFGCTVADKVTFFYVDDALVASTNPVWLQQAFGILIGLFEWLGLRTNVAKTVGIVCRPGTIYGIKSASAYGGRMNSKGGPHRERQ